MLDLLRHYSMTNPASVYDEEALTALELAGRTAHKVNECIGAFNGLEKETKESVQAVHDYFVKNIYKVTAQALNDMRLRGELDKELVNVKEFGAVGDGVTDDTEAFKTALSECNTLFVPAGTYLLSETIKLKNGQAINGDNREETILKFAEGVKGIQLNRLTNVANLSIHITGAGSVALYYRTSDNYTYSQNTLVDNIAILNDATNPTGTGILLVAEKEDTKPNGMYNILFSNINAFANLEFGIRILNLVKTTDAAEAWVTGVTFRNCFFHKVKTCILSNWEDVSGTNAVPATGKASKNGGICFERVMAQYVGGVTECFANIQNIINCQFVNCFPFDYWHLRYDKELPQYIFNVTENMCWIDLGNQPELSDTIYSGGTNCLPLYIGFTNSTGDFFTDMEKVVKYVLLESTGSIYGKFKNYDKTYDNFNHKPLPLFVNANKDTMWDVYHEEYAVNGILHYSAHTSDNLFVIGTETTMGGGVQMIINYGVSDAPRPVVEMRLKYNGTWYTPQRLAFVTE